MPAYIIVNVTIHDAARYEDYKKLTPVSLVPYQGKFIVRGAPTEVLEGNPSIGRLVILEFPTKELAKQWWDSEEYRPAKKLRHEVASSEMILVEGFVP